MRGSSMRKLPSGKSFTVLCGDKKSQNWFSKVLSGTYKEYDIDTVPRDILISLTSPNTPGSLASKNPAGLGPSAGPLIPINQVAGRTQQGATGIKLKFSQMPNSQIMTPAQGPTGRDCLYLSGATKPGDVRLSITNDDQAETDQDMVHPSNLTAATSKEENGTPVQAYKSPYETVISKLAAAQSSKNAASIQVGYKSLYEAAAVFLAAVQSSNNAAASTKRQNDSPLTSSWDKRAKIGLTRQQQETIDISSSDEENINPSQDDIKSPSNAAQNQKLMKEITALKLSESLALGKIEKLIQENTNLKLAKMCAVNRAKEALTRLRAANRANEVLGGNDDLVGQIEELMRENASLKLSALRPFELDTDGGCTGGIKSEGITPQVKKDVAGQRGGNA
ncbi:hypothetical protein V491_03735 [Pseudogymnoascus sp. VKM F-3775]|nr:hypothetical protein V491_03735 [Pseudogymnoascus sp. VKM F-3775]